ncbi:hypothetical protein BKA70DRAFT_1265645 [Coprinopsis sp. MPI-PUGE-AT-0042]|nr:hypothetical protein BKA70DRAFT_1265645 [Coprinopsis sp. MPI-PUGE-AT-0042]
MTCSMAVLEEQLMSATDAFLNALAANTAPLGLLTHFSTTHPVTLQHAPAQCPNAQSARFTGLNAVRSYFDLLTTNWTRTAVRVRSRPQLFGERRRAVIDASVTWVWRQSGRRWTEDFTCTLDFDDALKIVSFLVATESGPGTCVMTAKDTTPVSHADASICAEHLPSSKRRIHGSRQFQT